jgi:hypothetical protein
MISRKHHWLAVVFVFVLLGQSAGAFAADPPDLAGAWTMDAEASDDPSEEFRRWMQRRGRGGVDASATGGGGRGGGGGGGGAGGGGGRVGAGGAAALGGLGAGAAAAGRGGARGLMGMMQAYSQGVQSLRIQQQDPEMIIENANGVANTVFTDGRVIEREEEGGGKTKVRTRWKKDKLQVTVTFPSRVTDGGGTISPSLNLIYELDKQERMVVTTTVGLGGATPPLTVKRVYDRAESTG